jgi:hypothetical protein
MSLPAVVDRGVTTELGDVQAGAVLMGLIVLNIATLETYNAEPVQMGCESTL